MFSNCVVPSCFKHGVLLVVNTFFPIFHASKNVSMFRRDQLINFSEYNCCSIFSLLTVFCFCHTVALLFCLSLVSFSVFMQMIVFVFFVLQNPSQKMPQEPVTQGTVKDYSSFNGQQDAEALRKAMKGLGKFLSWIMWLSLSLKYGGRTCIIVAVLRFLFQRFCNLIFKFWILRS